MIKVVFVATHADEADHQQTGGVRKGDDGRYSSEKARAIKSALEVLYSNEPLFDLSSEHYVLDARAAWVADIKQLIEHLIRLKQAILDSLPRCTMFLNRTLFNIQNWRKILASTSASASSSGLPIGLSNSVSSTSLQSSSSHIPSAASTPSTPGVNNLQASFKFYGSTMSVNE